MASGGEACTQLDAKNLGAPWEVRHWQRADRDNCTCSGTTKNCVLAMRKQGLPRVVISSPREDAPAYPAFEIDGGVYGRLRTALGQQTPTRWVDVGANLGMLSIALALANPSAVGWAYEPNPSTFAYLRANIAANGLQDRLHAVNAGVSLDGRPIFMPNCVVNHPGGSQMASTQWRGGESSNRCFSGSCKAKQAKIEACMKSDPSMARIPSMTLEEAFATAGVPLNASSGEEQLSLLKVDCEGCEHELMPKIDAAKTSLKVRKVTGECHSLRGMSREAAAECLRVLRGTRCKRGVSPWMTCNN